MSREPRDGDVAPAGDESTRRLAGLPERNPHPVLICLGPGRLTYGNPAAERLVRDLGLDSARDLLPPDHRRIKRACLAASEPTTAEVIVRDRLIAWSYRPAEESGAVHLYGVDITELRRIGAGSDARTLQMAALDHLATGVVAVDAGRRILFSNAAADGLLASRDGLCARDGRLTAAIPRITERLERLVNEATGGVRAAAALAVPRVRGRAPLEILVSPVSGEPDERGAAAFVFLFDPESRADAASDVLASLFGLTPGETRLLEHLVDGASLKDVAARLGISKTTARNRLQDVFRKTGTRRQADLIKRVQAGPAGPLLHGLSASGSPGEGYVRT